MAHTLPRITARIDLDTQALLSKAAAISGVSSINAFILNASIEKAKQIIEQEAFLKLSKQDAMLLAEALDRPAQANPNLQAAFARHADTQTSQ